MKPINWTQERIDTLTLLWNDKREISASEIGRTMKISRNSVIGKVHRLGLPARESPIPVKKKIYTPVSKKHFKFGGIKKSKPNPNLKTDGNFYGKGKSLLEIGNNECRWLIGNLCCAAKTEKGQALCGQHRSIAYVPIKVDEN